MDIYRCGQVHKKQLTDLKRKLMLDFRIRKNKVNHFITLSTKLFGWFSRKSTKTVNPGEVYFQSVLEDVNQCWRTLEN